MKRIPFAILVFLSFLLGCKERSKTAYGKESAKEIGEKILFVVSNAHFYGDTDLSTSNHFSEIVHAYAVFQQAGFSIDFVSPKGGAIPIGYINTSDSLQKQFLYDNNFMDALEHTYPPETIDAQHYKAVYYGGGGAAMFGVPENGAIQKIVIELYEDHGGIVSAICHGTAGIANLKTRNGDYLVEGKKVNGFPDLFENEEAAYYKTFPFSIQQLISERGGDFQFSTTGWDGFHKVDGRLITGQDPTSAAVVAEMVVKGIAELNIQ
ncbi:type 1 glutamine amidotransferase domain-containing protein [Maribacter sp. 2-571]|uniref:type 1 glutamine amidotransferase domain-containing protein n=1 Tax=Maribacter sp. 2-571 TaxID=3417569 RepID=UPI003D34ADA0